MWTCTSLRERFDGRSTTLPTVSLKALVDEAGIHATYATELNKGMNLATYVRRK
jgi:hypothetical protein